MSDETIVKDEILKETESVEELEGKSGPMSIAENSDEQSDANLGTDQQSIDTNLNESISRVFCVKCGAELKEGQAFCPTCGHKVGAPLEEQVGSSEEHKDDSKKGNGKKIAIGALIALLAVGACAVFFFVIRGVQAKEIVLNKETLSVKAGESDSLKFTINPDNTKDKTVSWSTSNDTIATVSQGTVTGVNEGTCTVTVKTSNGKTDSCEITVTPAGPDLVAIYNEYCSSDYASVASDGSYIAIDTNPNNYDDYNDYEAMSAIYAVDDALGLPDSVEQKMGQTRSLDGMQTYEGDGIEVAWSYHPDNGLEVIYSLTGK